MMKVLNQLRGSVNMSVSDVRITGPALDELRNSNATEAQIAGLRKHF